LIKKLYLTTLIFSFGIIFSIALLGAGKLTLFSKKTAVIIIAAIISSLTNKLKKLKFVDLVFL
jgi:hypothetical protein